MMGVVEEGKTEIFCLVILLFWYDQFDLYVIRGLNVFRRR